MKSVSWHEFRQKAARQPQRILLAEGEDPRVVKAARVLQSEKIAHPWLVGSRKNIETLWKKNGDTPFTLPCIDYDSLPTDEKKAWADALLSIPKNKKQSREEA